jgi:CheY-like chemotaxis protein
MKEEFSIVIVDDDQDDHLLFEEAAKAIHPQCNVMPFYDGSEFIHYLEQRGSILTSTAHDVVVLDIHMPRLNGFEVLQRLKSDATLNSAPVYVLSTTKPNDRVRQALDFGAKKYFEKPWTTKGLEDIIREILNDFTHDNRAEGSGSFN